VSIPIYPPIPFGKEDTMENKEIEDLTDEDYFAYMKEMFKTKGWSILLLELEDQTAFIGDIRDISNNDNLHFRKGQISTIDKLLCFQETLLRAEEEALDV
jgi:hypothetical protein